MYIHKIFKEKTEKVPASGFIKRLKDFKRYKKNLFLNLIVI